MRFVLHSKIQKARITNVDPDSPSSSVVIDKDLIDRVGFWPGEKVSIVSNATGAKIETYVSDGERGTGIIKINGAYANNIKQDEEVTIMGFKLSEKQIDPMKILVDGNNKFVKVL